MHHMRTDLRLAGGFVDGKNPKSGDLYQLGGNVGGDGGFDRVDVNQVHLQRGRICEAPDRATRDECPAR